MLARAPKFLIVVALACSIGLHWAFLQSVAWVSMVVNYSHETTLKEAVKRTFDGQHPCALCNQVKAGKKSDEKSDQRALVKKLTFLNHTESFLFQHPDFPLPEAVNAFAPAEAGPPLLPPPRLS